MKYLFRFPFVALCCGGQCFHRCIAAACRWLSRQGESVNGQLLAAAETEIKVLREQVRRLREDHARESECLKGDLAIAERHVVQLTEVIERNRARVAAEMAIFTRREQDATQAMPGASLTQVED